MTWSEERKIRREKKQRIIEYIIEMERKKCCKKGFGIEAAKKCKNFDSMKWNKESKHYLKNYDVEPEYLESIAKDGQFCKIGKNVFRNVKWCNSFEPWTPFIDGLIETIDTIEKAKQAYRKKKEDILVGTARAMGLNPQKMDTPINCPFCGCEFKPCDARIVGDSTLATVAKGVVFLPWGVASAMKGKGIECPNCHMILRIVGR